MIFLCLTSSKEVSAVIEEMRPALAPETVIVDCSTGDPTVTVRLAETLAAQNVYFADAPLSRTPKEAWEGTLDCMVGADETTFKRIHPVISTWAAKIVHIGGVADGHRMKLLNNFISLGMGALFAEALAAFPKSRHLGRTLRQRHPGRAYGQRILPDLHGLCSWKVTGMRIASRFRTPTRI